MEISPHLTHNFWLVFVVTHQLSYLYSLTEDDKEDRAEDEKANDEGADKEAKLEHEGCQLSIHVMFM